MWQHPDKNVEHLMLDIGSGDPSDGELQPQGYALNDIDTHPWIDLVCDIKKLDQFVKPNQCKQIRASHVLEHFGTQETQEVINMLYTLIEPGGTLLMFVPNFMWHASLALSGKDADAIHYCFGGQKDTFDFHKTGYTPLLTKQRLEKAGFKDIDIQDGTSLTALAYK